VGSKRTARPVITKAPSRAGADAGSTTSFPAALPAVFGPGFKGYRPAMLTKSRR
jgi:hypothetical protein